MVGMTDARSLTMQPTVIKTEPMTVAALRVKGDVNQIPQAFETLYTWITENGWSPCGMPSAVYFTAPSEETGWADAVWELRAPIAEEEPERGPDKLGLSIQRLDAQEVAMVLHVGPYDQIGPVYESLGSWIGENGYQMVGPPEEVYLSDPDLVAPEQYETEVRFPVAKT